MFPFHSQEVVWRMEMGGMAAIWCILWMRASKIY